MDNSSVAARDKSLVAAKDTTRPVGELESCSVKTFAVESFYAEERAGEHG